MLNLVTNRCDFIHLAVKPPLLYLSSMQKRRQRSGSRKSDGDCQAPTGEGQLPVSQPVVDENKSSLTKQTLHILRQTVDLYVCKCGVRTLLYSVMILALT